MNRTRQAVVYAVTLAAAFTVGILLGRHTCAPEPEVEIRKEIVERKVRVEPDGCNCGEPDTGTPTAAPPPPEERAPKDENELPDAPPAPNPAARKRLLSNVREKSGTLQPCRPKSMSDVRFTVTLTIGKAGAIEKVGLNAPDENVPRETLSCLRRRMADWSLPAELVEGRREIVFGLEL